MSSSPPTIGCSYCYLLLRRGKKQYRLVTWLG